MTAHCSDCKKHVRPKAWKRHKCAPVYLCPFCLEPCGPGHGLFRGVWVHDPKHPEDENMHPNIREAMGFRLPTDENWRDEYILPWEV